MNTRELLKQISCDLEAQVIYDEFMQNVSMLSSPHKRICIMGHPNCGKTTFLNSLLEIELVTSSVSSNKEYVITYDEKEHVEESSKGADRVYLNNRWLKDNDVQIIEVNNDIVHEELSQLEVCRLLSICDACIYIMNSQSAFNRTDKLLLQSLDELSLPTIVLLSRADILSDDDYIQVKTFVNDNLLHYKNVTFIDIAGVALNRIGAETLKSQIEVLLSKMDIIKTRAGFENFYLGYALSRLFEQCQNNILACHEKQEGIRQLTSAKKSELNEKTAEWLKLETQFRQKMIDISGKLRIFLTGREEDMVRRLSHDVDVCGDIKLFWEKDFQFRLEEMMKAEVNSAMQMVNQELLKAVQWLQDSLIKRFRCKMSVASGITNDRNINVISSASDVEVTDTNKLKIFTRIGTAATIITAGALFATSGIGGIVMAVSMMSGVGAEFIMRKKSNDSKESIKKRLPEIISRTQLHIITDFDHKIGNMTSDIVSQIHSLKEDWIESSFKGIEQDESIALFNFSPAKWENIMDRINNLSAIILK